MNPYETLDVKADATAEQLKKARQKLAKKLHPDRGGDAQAMADVNKAYDLLTDQEARQRYDETGSTASVRSIEEEATNVLRQIIQQFIGHEQNLDTKNVVVFVRSAVNQALQQMVQQAAQAQAAITKLEKKLTKLESKGHATLLQDMFTFAIQQRRESLNSLEHGKLTMERCQEMLNDYIDSTIEVKDGPSGIYSRIKFT